MKINSFIPSISLSLSLSLLNMCVCVFYSDEIDLDDECTAVHVLLLFYTLVHTIHTVYIRLYKQYTHTHTVPRILVPPSRVLLIFFVSFISPPPASLYII